MKIAKGLKAHARDVGELKLKPDNARKHTDEQLQAIAFALEENGQQTPIVVSRRGVVLKGNGTFRAAVEILGATKIAALTFDGKASQENRYAIADNATSDLSEFDLDVVAEQLRAFEDAEEFATQLFDTSALDRLFPDEEEAEPPPVDPASTGGKTVKFAPEHWAIIAPRIEALREHREDPEMPEGHAITELVSQWVATG